MNLIRVKDALSMLLILFALICTIQPVLANNETVVIAYRGAGGYYIGDSIIFDGSNSVGKITVLTITGPDLPEEGLPLSDLNGSPGSGNAVETNPDGTWKFVWYSSGTKGIEKLQTARYYITARDLEHPEIYSKTKIMLKKPEFYVTASPSPAQFDDYVQLNGNAERGISYAKIDITDMSGKILHTYISPVSASGYFNFGFHVDMQPGQYQIIVSNPAMKNTLRLTLEIVSPGIQQPVPIIPGKTPITSEATTASASPSVTPSLQQGAPSPGSGSILIESVPSGASVFLDSSEVGTTPLTLNNIPAGSHHIEIKTPGYAAYSVDTLVKNGETVTISPTLLKGLSRAPLSIVTVLAGVLLSVMIIIFLYRNCRNP